ncbi:MAG: phospho-N-acetylmuramoyl-pentapeptide-transferase [Oscillospiraceae bacterium]|nr:phospho-N-acetylmuramoyl-pentapeptide-transferase [Oscillospiraceae bacterium]
MIRIALMITAITSLAVTALSGFFFIPFLKRLKYGQTIKEIGPTWHKGKQGTPTMGGLMFILGTLVGILSGAMCIGSQIPDLMGAAYVKANYNLFMCFITALAFGFVGFVDDFIKVVKKRNLGLKARYKIIMQVFITTVFLISLYLNGELTTAVQFPFLGIIDFGIFYYPITFLLIIFTVNAVNLTDGIDGLASSVTFVGSLGFMIITSLLSQFTLGLFAAAIAGGCAGFLAWNFYPAKVFMGDTGSMFLGGAVVALAFGMGHPELLFLIGLIYMIEAASVVIQVTYFKLTHGKRLFKMSPIHHHFEMCGWSEIKIVTGFSFVTLVCVLLSCIYIYVSC